MKSLKVLQDLLSSDPNIEATIIDNIIWDLAEGSSDPAPSAVVSVVPDATSIEKWTKFNETGLFSVSSFPPFRKAKQIAIGTRYPVKDLKKVTLKHGEAVSILKNV